MYQNGKFLPRKSVFHAAKKSGKSDFAPSEKYSSAQGLFSKFLMGGLKIFGPCQASVGTKLDG